MIAHTTATLGGKLGKVFDVKTKAVIFAPFEQVLGKLRDRGTPEYLPAMSVDRKSIGINRENVIRSTAARRGFPISGNPSEGEVKYLHTLPVRVEYDIGLVAQDRDMVDRAENNLLWWLEEEGGDIGVQVRLAGVEFELPMQITPSTTDEVFNIEREEEWEKARLYKMSFSLTATSFLLRSSLKPTILKIGYKIVNESDGYVLVENNG